MKRIIAIVCLTMATITNIMAQQSDVPVILTAGQSNADGRVPVAELPDYVHYDYCQWSYGSGDYLTATGDFMPFSPTVARKDLGDRWGFDAIVYYLLEQQWKRPFYVIKQTMGGTAIFATAETMVASDYVGIVSGRDTPDKMEKAGWTVEKAPNVNAPVFKEFPMTLECRVKQKIDESETGYYLVAEIVNILCDEKYLAEDGKPDVEKMELITFDPVHHTYIQLGKTIGHAFSDGKQLK